MRDSPSPLAIPLFRQLWIANLLSNIGFWLQATAAGWIMTDLTHSPLLNSSIQIASTLPVFLFALPAGMIADGMKKSVFLFRLQLIRSVAAVILAVMTLSHLLAPWSLITLTFVLGITNAMNMPAWQGAIGNLVPPQLLPQAASLNNLSFNLGRSLGGMIAGGLLAYGSAGVAFLLNAVSATGLISTYRRWQKTEHLPEEESQKGFRHLIENRSYQKLLIHSFVLFFFGTSIWGLLPLFCKTELGSTSISYGLMTALIGLGSVIAALMIKRFTLSITFASLGLALSIATIKFVPYLSMVGIGITWSVIVSMFNANVQKIFSTTYKARAAAFFLMVFYAALTLGNACWGFIAETRGIYSSLLVSAFGLLLASSARLTSYGYNQSTDR